MNLVIKIVFPQHFGKVYAILNSPSSNSTLKLTFAYNALNTRKIVSIVTFLAFLSIREILRFHYLRALEKTSLLKGYHYEKIDHFIIIYHDNSIIHNL